MHGANKSRNCVRELGAIWELCTLHLIKIKTARKKEKIYIIYTTLWQLKEGNTEREEGIVCNPVQSLPEMGWRRVPGFEFVVVQNLPRCSRVQARRMGDPVAGKKTFCGRGGKTSRLLTCKCIFHYCALKSEFVIFHYFSRHPFSQNYLSFSPQKS